MSTFNIYQMSKVDVISTLHCSYNSLLKDTIRYCQLTQKNNSNVSYERLAEELIYAECVKKFNYNEYVRSAGDALRRIDDPKSTFRQMINTALKKEEEAQKRAEKEEARIKQLKKKCEDNGLDFAKENEKHLIKRKKISKIADRTFTVCLVCFILSLIACVFGGGDLLYGIVGLLPWISFILGIIAANFLDPSEKK